MITKEFIDEQRDKISRKIGHLEQDIKRSKTYDEIGSASEDAALEAEEFEEKTALGNDLEKELQELKTALKRINEGVYGVCEKCKGPIETARLKAIPQSRFCASDK